MIIAMNVRFSNILSMVCVSLWMLEAQLVGSRQSCSDSLEQANETICSCKLSTINGNIDSFGFNNPLSINEKRRMVIKSTWAPNVTWGICVFSNTGYLLNEDTLSPQPPYTCNSGNLTLAMDLVIRRGTTDPSTFWQLTIVYSALQHQDKDFRNRNHCHSPVKEQTTAIVHFTPLDRNIHVSVTPDTNVTRGTNVTMTCYTRDGYPTVQSYYWLISSMIDNKPHFQKYEGYMHGSKSIIYIVGARPFNSGEYKCVAVNYPFAMTHKTVSKDVIYLRVT